MSVFAYPGPIIGTTTNTNAAAGIVGEIKSSVVLSGASVNIPNGAVTNITTLDVTAGDWDVDGEVWLQAAAGTLLTQVAAGIFTSTGALPNVPSINASEAVITNAFPATSLIVMPLKTCQIIVSVTTTLYLVGFGSFSVSTLGGFGAILARRAR